jgi:hypothetical protein
VPSKTNNERCDVQDYVQRIRPDAVARGQEGVRAAEFCLIARGALGEARRHPVNWTPPAPADD